MLQHGLNSLEGHGRTALGLPATRLGTRVGGRFVVRAQTNVVKVEAVVFRYGKATDLPRTIKGMNVTGCLFQNVLFKLPLIVPANTIDDTPGLQAGQPTGNFAGSSKRSWIV